MHVHAQGSPEGTVQVQLILLAQEALGQPELAATSDARLQAAFGQAGRGDIVQTGERLRPVLCILDTACPTVASAVLVESAAAGWRHSTASACLCI